MVGNSIQVFARLKTEHKLKEKWYDIVRKNQKYDDLIFYKDRAEDNYTSSKFRFCQVFDQEVDQDRIFTAVAKPVVSSVLQGFNGTIFAYGQTGSGKTYTMTGSTKKYEDRGIIPRSLQFIFSAIEKTEEKPTLYISYMEIYNEVCYDLLHPKDTKTASRLEDLPRVVVLEDKGGAAHLRNLSVLPVSTEEEAIRFLFLGDTNRAIAETPLNEYSSRSHCLFTIYITSRPNDSQTLRYAKLNLVDLAGSERVHKSSITGTILNEAKHINLSLHFLQQVILALSESRRLHIPYRNSLMTFILKDSLAGNCLSVMLATLAVSKENILETISTCKFAQRVSMIKTEPIINEVSDPYQEIMLLRNEVQELRKQLAKRNNSVIELEGQSLTNMQKEECEKKLEEYLNSSEKSFKMELDAKLLQYCFLLFKTKIQTLEHKQVVDHNKLQTNKTFSDSIESSTQNYHTMTNDVLTSNSALLTLSQDDSLLQEFMSNPQNCEEINYYNKTLACIYQKAKILALAIEECQANISYIREKLDIIGKTGCSKQKIVLGHELEYQQKIYRKSLVELKELKHETVQLEAGLKKSKAKMLQRFNKWTRARDNCDEEKQKYQNFDFKNDPITFKNDGVSLCSKKPWEVSPDFEPIQYQSSQWDESSNQSEFFTCKKHPQHQNYYDGRDLTEDALKCNCALQGRCINKNLRTASDICYLLDTQHIQKRKKSSRAFLPQIKNHGQEFKRSQSECTCSKTYFPQIGNNKNQIYYDNDYANFGDKNIINQCSEGVQCKQSSKDCYCRGRYHGEVNHSNSLFPSSDCCPNQTFPAYLNLETQSNVSCCCIKDSLPGSASSESQFSRKHDNQRFNVNDIIKENLSSVSSVVSPAYFDTQLVPNKLDTKSTKEVSSAKAILGSSPNCHDKPIRLVNKDNETRKEETKESQFISLENSTSKEYDIFLGSDTDEFRKFMESISLTGDEEIDKEICNFYRGKVFL